MARTFDGTNDNLLSANNAVPALDVATKSFGMWVYRTTTGANDSVLLTLTANGGGNQVTLLNHDAPVTAGFRQLVQQNNVGNGQWKSDDISINARHYIVVTYDRSSLSNDPTIDVDGAASTVTETLTPSGTIKTGDDTLKMGESAGGVNDMTGQLQHVCIASEIWSAAQKNRAMWWGRPGGGSLVSYFPFVTTKLVDEAGAGETLTATGTTVSSMSTPVVRPGAAMMGCGVGW